MIGLARLAAAQPADSSIAAFLEKRVPDELASEGIVLSRDHLALKIEQLGDKLLVSLVDLSTGRIAASTKVDQIPTDRDAAVASVTHVVADLAGQAMHRDPAPPPPPPDARADAAQRDLAEMRFRRQELWFSLPRGTTEGPLDTQRWRVFQGDTGEQLDPVDFYTKVGRDDLVAAYHQRHNVMITSLVISGATILGATALFVKMASVPQDDCSVSLPAQQFGDCITAAAQKQEQEREGYATPALILGGVGLVGFLFAGWYAAHLQPISEREAKSLADQYNQGLRRNLGLPVVERRPRLHDIRLVPYVAGHDAGLAFGARF